MPQGCRFEAVASDVSGWLSTEAAHRASRVFAAAGGRHLPAVLRCFARQNRLMPSHLIV